ncbi:MAG: lipoprotein signal peptidase [Bacteroidota bacterium]
MKTLQKIKLPLITIFVVLFMDQAIKIWIKSSFPLEHHIPNVPLGEANSNKVELLFIENPGMAFGVEFGGSYGKLALSLFRIVAAILGVIYIRHIVNKQEHRGYIFSVSLIFAGAVGNIIDCAFYGLIFSESTFNKVAVLFPPEGGYAGFLHGKVVDMFHFPIWQGHFPEWFPFWGGDSFEFFSPIFNLADASISIGVALIFIFQKRFFKNNTEENESNQGSQKNEASNLASNDLPPENSSSSS